jgi:threonyl-tRNA synthetase
VTPAEVAASHRALLAKAAISAQVNGKHWDLAWPIQAMPSSRSTR